MKKVKIAVAAMLSIALLLFAFLYIKSDGARGVIRYSVSAEIRARPEAVYRAITRPEELRRWLKGYVRSIPLDEKRTAVGARAREIMKVKGKQFEFTSVLTEVQPGRLLAIKLSHPDMESLMRYEISTRNGISLMVLKGETRFKPFPQRLLAPFIKTEVIKINHENLKRLKLFLEGK